jgi:hypothetical protein
MQNSSFLLCNIRIIKGDCVENLQKIMCETCREPHISCKYDILINSNFFGYTLHVSTSASLTYTFNTGILGLGIPL